MEDQEKEPRKAAVDHLREEVWGMQRAGDIRRIALSLKDRLKELGIPFSAFGINVVEERPEGVRFYDYTGREMSKSLSVEQSAILERFWRGGQPVYRPDLLLDDPYGENPFLNQWQIRSVLDVPFSHGTAAISSRQPNAFSTRDIEILQELVGVLSEGFQRMRDFQLLEQRNRELEQEIAERQRREQQQQARFQVREQVWKMKSTDDIVLVLEALGANLQAMGVPFMYCGVNIIDIATRSSTMTYTLDQQGGWKRREFSGDQLIVAFWERQELVYRRDLDREDPYGERARIARLRAIVDVPFSHGTLAVSSREPEVFSEADLEVLRDMAGILSEGFRRMEDLRALEQRYRELEQEIAERRRAETLLRESLREKIVLLKEIHHRVKNNLQVVSSLLNLQAHYLEDDRIRNALQDSRTRIESMALVHEKLYESDDLGRINFGGYLRTLARHVFDSFETIVEVVDLRIDTDPIIVDVDFAIHCGLIVNELVSNSLKYAFRDRGRGNLGIELKQLDDEQVLLRVCDDGIGFPADLDFRRTESLGMQLVVDLTDQLEGTIELAREGGTAFSIVFPLPDDAEDARL